MATTGGTTNQAQFNLVLTGWTEKLRKIAGQIQKKVTFDLHSEIMINTPVDTGRARANWFVTVGEPSTEVHPHLGATKDSIPMPPPAMIEMDGTKPSFITNNLPYIQRLDEGHSKQKPTGFVRQAILKVKDKIETELRDAAK